MKYENLAEATEICEEIQKYAIVLKEMENADRIEMLTKAGYTVHTTEFKKEDMNFEIAATYYNALEANIRLKLAELHKILETL